MSISTCPNCAYQLVLLERRRKYKCAECSKLFLQKEIEDYNFRNWNKKQKENDMHNLKLEAQRPKLTEQEKLQRRQEYCLKNKEKYKEYSEKYYYKNKEKINLRIIEHRKNNKEWHNNYVKKWRLKTLSKRRIQWQMQNFRKRLKQLALQYFKSNNHKPSKTKIIFYPPTISLSQLLNFR